MDFNPEKDAEYVGGRKLCPLCELHIEERQQTCRQCAVPGEQCACGAQVADDGLKQCADCLVKLSRIA